MERTPRPVESWKNDFILKLRTLFPSVKNVIITDNCISINGIIVFDLTDDMLDDILSADNDDYYMIMNFMMEQYNLKLQYSENI